jgi:hypothetical protein
MEYGARREPGVWGWIEDFYGEGCEGEEAGNRVHLKDEKRKRPSGGKRKIAEREVEPGDTDF